MRIKILCVTFNWYTNLYQWGYLYNVGQIISLIKWKSSKKTNLLKIVIIQKFSLFKDVLCRMKRYTFFKTLVFKTMPPSIKFLQYKMIQSNHFVKLLIVQHFTRVSKLCNFDIFVSQIIVTRKLVSFHLFFLLCCDLTI